ncbi:hypothetical protein CC80DRAFT_87864 [Byssothecium circinans]|uniref:Uncharacterized protein n=1 Tax=Byssothecium circinans TaxID=147558 RepID=A0A6A5TRP5_9PLEO|nr:hypothetical protein CC80DRAFT_87864 [Byssothecium circinans]
MPLAFVCGKKIPPFSPPHRVQSTKSPGTWLSFPLVMWLGVFAWAVTFHLAAVWLELHIARPGA